MAAIATETSPDGKTLTIRVTGSFTYDLHREFREAYERHPGLGTSFVVDLAGTDYLDSSGLGMLLVLREHAGGEAARVNLANPSAEVRRVLTIAHFERLFGVS
jgi:anti-anti-sigma factor